MPRAAVASAPENRESPADVEIRSLIARASRPSAYERMPALSAFQRQMERFPLLQPEEQLVLVSTFQDGVRAKEELQGKLRVTAERKARDRVKRGEHAIEHLAGSSFRLLILICRENAEERYGRERAMEILPDLVSEANAALVEAAQNYDPSRGPQFHTYAARVVRDRVRMILTKEGPLRLAPSWNRLKRIASVRIPALAAELGRNPTDDEIKQALLDRCMEWAEGRLTPEQQALPEPARTDAKMAKLRKQGMLGAIERFADVLVATQSIDSLDRVVSDDGGSTVGELVVTAEAFQGGYDAGGFDEVEKSELMQALMGALEALPDREKDIILRRYGFIDGESWTYGRIAEIYGVTAERIRQIERLVLTRLSAPHSDTRSTLAAFLPDLLGDDHDGRD